MIIKDGSNMTKILVVEDEVAIQEMLTFFLESNGFEVVNAYDFMEGLSFLSSNESIKLVILDWMIPKGSGVELLRKIRCQPSLQKLPVLMLTARGELDDKLEGFSVGADDYMSKPFSLKELLARIQVLLRLTNQQATEELPNKELICNDMKVDIEAHRVFIENEEVLLGRIEFKLLVFLLSHPERVYSRNQLLDHVWGIDSYIDERTVDVSVKRLRHAIKDKGYDKYFQTVRGEGYRFSKL